MTALDAVISRVAAVIPLTLLALGFCFVLIVAVLRPTPARQEMVDRLGKAIKELGAVIAGPANGRGAISSGNNRKR
jgi:hypothetical protein